MHRFKWTGYRNNLSRRQVSNVVFKVYSTDIIQSNIGSKIRAQVWNTLLVIPMAWGICFVSLCCHSTFPDLQKLMTLRSDKGNIKRHSVLPKEQGDLKGRKVTFQVPSISTTVSQSILEHRWPELCCSQNVPWPFQRTAPSHTACSSLAPALHLASHGFHPLHHHLCSFWPVPVLFASADGSHSQPTSLVLSGSLHYRGPVWSAGNPPFQATHWLMFNKFYSSLTFPSQALQMINGDR